MLIKTEKIAVDDPISDNAIPLTMFMLQLIIAKYQAHVDPSNKPIEITISAKATAANTVGSPDANGRLNPINRMNIPTRTLRTANAVTPNGLSLIQCSPNKIESNT
jgi:hypothetical protein